MGIDIWKSIRQKKREPLWSYRVIDGEKVIFQSRQVSVRFLNQDAALWVARLVEQLGGPGEPLGWTGDLADDCSVETKELLGRAEHLYGPRRGGAWYCAVYGTPLSRYFHTADRIDIQSRSGSAARWLCELVISAAEVGLIQAEPW